MTYKPCREDRFEYIWDLMSFIEENQCVTCRFKSDRDEYPMCFEIEGEIITEEPVEALDDRGSAGVVCNRYELEPVEREPDDPDQLTLL